MCNFSNFFRKCQNLILTSQKYQDIACRLSIMNLHDSIIRCLYIILYGLENVVDLGWKSTTFYTDYTVCLEELHEFCCLYCS